MKAKNSALNQIAAEHRCIEAVVKSLSDAIAALDQRRRLNVDKLRAVVEFLRVYADERHHQREEGALFPVLIKRGVPAEGCPLAGLNHEHEKGRGLVSALEEWIGFYEQQRPGAEVSLRRTLQGIIDLYRKHLWMEDAMVFPMAERLLTPADHHELIEKFGQLDARIGVEAIRRFETFAGSVSFSAGNAPVACLESAPAGS